jgi:hypothetical protein
VRGRKLSKDKAMTLALVEIDQEILRSLPEDMREEFFFEERVDRR